MPLLPIPFFNPIIRIKVWRILESMDFFLAELHIKESFFEELKIYSDKRKMEMVGVKYLLLRHFHFKEIPLIIKDKNNKPFLANKVEHISITHSHGVVGVSLSKLQHGIDIERISDRILRLKERFINEEELNIKYNMPPATWYTLIWSCKESIFKAINMQGVNFKKHIFVNITNFNGKSGSGSATILMPNFTQKLSLNYINLGEEIFTLAVISK